MGDCSLSMMDFIDWLNSKYGEGVVFCVSLCIVWLFDAFVYAVYTFLIPFVMCC